MGKKDKRNDDYTSDIFYKAVIGEDEDDNLTKKKKHDDDDNDRVNHKHDKHDKYDDRRDHNHRNDNNNNNNRNDIKLKKYNNAVIKLMSKEYNRKSMIRALVDKNGLFDMIEDLKYWADDRQNNQKPPYVMTCIRDVVFASALPTAIEECLDQGIISKKDIDYLLSEILIYVNTPINLKPNYSKEVLDSMDKAYVNILYKFSKKKVKKLIEEVKGMSEEYAKKIVVLTSGKNIYGSIYPLIKYLYSIASDKDVFPMTEKNLTKLFKVCYGKDRMGDIVKCIMLEKVGFNTTNMSSDVSNVWVILSDIMYNYLESLNKKEIRNIINSYIDDRRRQERNGPINRRFGDRRTIHPDDYEKITEVCKQLEEEDISVIPFLRK